MRSYPVVQPWTDHLDRAEADQHQHANTAARTAFIGHRFGGLKRRYRENFGATLRCIDPFTGAPMMFGSELSRENWLLRRFDPQVVTTSSVRTPLQIIDRGVLRSALFHLRSTFIDGSTCLDVVVQRAPHKLSNESSVHQHVATAHGLRCELRSRTEIRANPILLDNLEHFRRVLTLNIEQALVPLSALRRVMAVEPQCCLDALLSRLDQVTQSGRLLANLMVMRAYLCGVVHLNIREVPYGLQTVVRLL